MFENSVWELESFYAPNDVIIAGSGLAGLWSAYYLKKFSPKLRILIIEKGIIPSGASTRNAGFACFGSVTELLDDAHTLGEQRMLELVEMRYEGLSKMKKIFTNKQIAYEAYNGYELIAAQQYAKRKNLTKDIGYVNNLLRKITKDKTTFRLADDKIRDFGFNGSAHLIKNKLEGQLHSGLLAQTLLDKVQAMGVRIMTGIALKEIQQSGENILLHTNLRAILSARQLLLCTNAFTRQLLPGINISPARGQVLVTSPINNLAFKGSFHYDEGYYYFRNLGNRVLLGGARNKAMEAEQTDEFTVTDIIQQELERFLKAVVLPRHNFTIDHRWSGIMGMGKDKFPIIKQIQPNVFCAVGMGGIGVALAPVVGESVANLMIK